MYDVVCYYKTNLSTVNIPASMNFLDANFEKKTFPALDIVQGGLIGGVSIRASWDDVKYCDYCVLRRTVTPNPPAVAYYETWCYSVVDVDMTSNDVAVLALALDAVTTFGGMENIEVFGVTSRISTLEWQEEEFLQAQDEVFFENGDPLMMPSDPLLVSFSSVDCSTPQTIGQGGNFIESTIDLSTLGDSSYNDARAYVNQGQNTIQTVAKLPPCQNTTYSFVGGGIQLTRQTGLFKDYGIVKEGLMAARSLGVDGCIINQVEIPSQYVVATIDSVGRVTSMEGVRGEKLTMATGIIDNIGQATDLKRVHYGDFCKLGIVTATGASFESRVEELYYENRQYFAHIQYMSDVRPDGAPYYKLCTKQNYSPIESSQIQNPGFSNFQNALKGSQWKQIPLVFYEKSGSLLDTLNYNAEQEMKTQQFDYAKAGLTQSERNIRRSYNMGVQGVALSRDRENMRYAQGQAQIVTGLGEAAGGAIAGAATGGFIGGPAGAAIGATLGAGTAIMNAAINGANNEIEHSFAQKERSLQLQQLAQAQNNALTQNKLSLGQLNEQYNAQRAIDKMNFSFSQNAVVPSIFFAYNSDVIRDFCGNGVLVYRTFYSQYDQRRISILLNAFGMYHRTELRKELFTNQNTNHFTYFEAGGISIGGTTYNYDGSGSSVKSLPQWAVHAITLQLQSGVRVWHTLASGKPVGDRYYYENMVNYKYRT